MKILLVLCLVALSAAEEDSQEQTQTSESTPINKPPLPQANSQPFSGQFPTPTLNFGSKDTGSVPFAGNSNFFSQPQGAVAGALPNFPQGVLPSFPQGVGSGALPSFPQGVGSGSLPNFPQGVGSGSLPNFPQGVGSGALPNFPQGVGTGALPNFPQGIINSALPNFSQVPRTLYQGGSTLGNGFHVPTSGHSVVSGLGNHFPGYTGGVYPGYHGTTQGVPVGSFNGNTGNTGYIPTTYRVLPQEALSGFTAQQLQHQNVHTTGGLPSFPGSVLSSVPNPVFTTNQGVLKGPITGTPHGGLNLPALTTGNVPSETGDTVFRRA